MKDENDHKFEAGVLCALAVVSNFGQDTIFDEIVRACGRDKLIKEARRTGNMKYSGMSEYLKRKR